MSIYKLFVKVKLASADSESSTLLRKEGRTAQ